MTEIGKMNKLTVKKLRTDGAVLDGGAAGEILLPQKVVPTQCRPGDSVDVFVYVDRERRLLATTLVPAVTVGQAAWLRVVATAAFGAYLGWGLENDLLVPNREQLDPMKVGRSYCVFAYLDERTSRVTASSKLNRFIDRSEPDYIAGEPVDLLIYAQTSLGYKAVVNHSHWGLIYKNEVLETLQPGQALKGYIKAVRDDLKIDISLRQIGHKGLDTLANTILETMQAGGGRLAVSDKSTPEEIYALFGVSKKRFKKAIGALYKRRLITMGDKGIRLIKRSG